MSSLLSKTDRDLSFKWFKDIDLKLNSLQSEELVDNALSFWNLFEVKNRVINLTANKDFSSWYWKNFMDSLLAASFLSDKSFIDWGTGGGFPVIPIALFQKSIGIKKDLVCIDSVAKKIIAVNEFASMLNLPVRGFIGRGESLCLSSPWGIKIDTITIRAVAPPERMLPWMVKSMVPNWFLYLGPNQLDLWKSFESRLAQKSFSLSIKNKVELPMSFGSRVLVLIKKI